MRIRIRLALYGGLVIFGAIVVFGIVLIAIAGGAAETDRDTRLTTLSSDVTAALRTSPVESIISSVTLDLATSTEPFIMVTDEAGMPLATTGLIEGQPLRIPAAVIVEALQTGESMATVDGPKNASFRVHARSLSGDTASRVRVVIAGQSVAFVEEQIEQFRAVVWLAGFFTLLGAFAAGWVVSKRSLRPLRELAVTTDEIGETGDLSRRLPPIKHKDEVGRLTTSFNTMLDELAASRGRLEGALNEQRRFVADASHELRTPLTSIRNNAGFLRDRTDASPQDRAAAIADIAAEADHMTLLIDDLLALARSDAGHQLKREHIDLRHIVEDTASRHPASTAFSVHTNGAVPMFGNELALQRVVRVLLDNAVKHGAASQDEEVDVRLDTAESSATLTVADRGRGLGDIDPEKLFDRFYRSDRARSTPGFGLGLAIASEIVDQHGGQISAANGANGGAMFTVVLPVSV